MPELERKKRPFIDTLRSVERGRLLNELTEIQNEVVSAVQLTGKQGEITVTFKYKQEAEGQLRIDSSYKHKAPKPPRGGTMFFTTPEGNLLDHDPDQPQLPLQAVPDETPATPRQVND